MINIYDFAMEKRDLKRIEKLNNLHNKDRFWDDVRKITKKVNSDHTIRRWQCLAEIRYEELKINREFKNFTDFHNYWEDLVMFK